MNQRVVIAFIWLTLLAFSGLSECSPKPKDQVGNENLASEKFGKSIIHDELIKISKLHSYIYLLFIYRLRIIILNGVCFIKRDL